MRTISNRLQRPAYANLNKYENIAYQGYKVGEICNYKTVQTRNDRGGKTAKTMVGSPQNAYDNNYSSQRHSLATEKYRNQRNSIATMGRTIDNDQSQLTIAST